MTFEKIAALIAENRGISADTVKLETTFAELGFDSLDVVELAMTLEQELNVSIEVNESIKTVGDVVNYIENAK